MFKIADLYMAVQWFAFELRRGLRPNERKRNSRFQDLSKPSPICQQQYIHMQELGYADPFRYSCHILGQISIVVHFYMYTKYMYHYTKMKQKNIPTISFSSWLIHFWYCHSEIAYQVGIRYIWGANLISSKCWFLYRYLICYTFSLCCSSWLM